MCFAAVHAGLGWGPDSQAQLPEPICFVSPPFYVFACVTLKTRCVRARIVTRSAGPVWSSVAPYFRFSQFLGTWEDYTSLLQWSEVGPCGDLL